MPVTPDDIAELKSLLRRSATGDMTPQDTAMYSAEAAAVRLVTGRDPRLLTEEAFERALGDAKRQGCSPSKLRDLARDESFEMLSWHSHPHVAQKKCLVEWELERYVKSLKADAVKARHRIEAAE